MDEWMNTMSLNCLEQGRVAGSVKRSKQPSKIEGNESMNESIVMRGESIGNGVNEEAV